MSFYFGQNGTLRLAEFEQWPWLVYGFSTRPDGDLAREDERHRFLESLGAGDLDLVTLRQIHSAIVRVADGRSLQPPGDGARPPGDSLIAVEPGVLVGVKTADCLPVLLVDPERRAVAAVHAGWRGVVKRVVEKTAGEMRRRLGCAPSRMHAAIGPGIQACCFEVGPEVLQEFASQFADAAEFCRPEEPNPALTMIPKQVMTGNHALMRRLDSDRGHIDLAHAIRRQLLTAGLEPQHIYNSGLCTACDLKRFYSYRREREAAGRMLAVIGVRPAP